MHMECFAMDLRRMIMATGTAALLAVATITTASAQGVQGQERARTNAGASGPNWSTSGQVNAQGRAGTSGVNAQTQFQGSSRSQAQFQGSNRGEFQATNRRAMTNQRYSGRDRFANGRDRSRFAASARFSDSNRFAAKDSLTAIELPPLALATAIASHRPPLTPVGVDGIVVGVDGMADGVVGDGVPASA